MLEALKALSVFFTENSLRTRRNLRGDIERRSLTINEEFARMFKEVKEVNQIPLGITTKIQRFLFNSGGLGNVNQFMVFSSLFTRKIFNWIFEVRE